MRRRPPWIVIVLLVAMGTLATVGTAVAAPPAAPPAERGSGFAPSTRAAAQQLYDDLYLTDADSLINWDGSVSGCLDGETSAPFKAGVQRRINYFRAMAGVPDDITLSPTLNSAAQGAALLMAANQDLNHTPPKSWTCHTAARSDAAGQSNLHLGSVGAAAITGYMRDAGSSNGGVGHRRWLLQPQTQQMGTGDVKMPSWQSTTNALVVFDDHTFDPQLPDLRDDFVAWPPPGFVPVPVVFPRWSISVPGGNVSSASVTMTRNGTPIAVNLLTPENGYGQPTLVWEPQVDLTIPADFHVSVTGVTVSGSPRTYDYDVHAFGPDGTPPVATLRTPGSGATYRQGATVAADFDCSDGAGGSGVASCVGTVADGQPIDTTTLGTRQFSVTATDNVGLQATTSTTYTVATRPDLAASVGAAGTIRGNNTYGTAVTTTQTLSANVARGATRTYVAHVGNDGGASATFRLRAAATGASGFTLKVKHDGVDITSQVLAGTYPVANLAPGATVALKVKVTATTASARAAVRNVDLTLTSTDGPTTKDKFRLRTTRS